MQLNSKGLVLRLTCCGHHNFTLNAFTIFYPCHLVSCDFHITRSGRGGTRMSAVRIWRRDSQVIGLSVAGNWILRSTTHSALQSTILNFLYFEDSSNPCLQAFCQTCAGFYIVTIRFRIVDTPSLASAGSFSFHIEDSD